MTQRNVDGVAGQTPGTRAGDAAGRTGPGGAGGTGGAAGNGAGGAAGPAGRRALAPPLLGAPDPALSISAPRRARGLRIDTDALKRRWFRDDKGERTTLARDFQEIKRPLLDAALGRHTPALANGRRLMVTSALPREGKTFCAINLALSIAAERDHGVVLVDADVARPSVPRELGVRTDRGLIDGLLDENLPLSELVCPTNIKRFSILPAGMRHRNATELLSSAAMGRFLDRLSSLYPDEIIVFDSPPLMVTSEARALASHMGQIVVVVAAGETPRDVVTEALAKLNNTAIAGTILNKMPASRRNALYGNY